MPPIFVVGAPRTGTTLVKTILNQHSQVHLFDEVHFFERVWDDREHLGDLASPMSQTKAIQRVRDIVRNFGSDKHVADTLTVEVFRRRLMEEGRTYPNVLRILLQTGAEAQNAEFWGDSSPQDVLYLDTILSWYPDAKIVCLVRDPRGYLSSCKNYYRRQVGSYKEKANPFTQSLLWKSYMTAVVEAEDRPYAPSVMRLYYEDLVTNPEAEVKRLAAHVGVDFESAMLDVGQTNTSFPGQQEGRGIFATSSDRWRQELSPTELWIGEKIYGETMELLGYERTKLDGGEPPKPDAMELLKLGAVLPARAYNHIFNSHKPVKLSKVKRVFSLFRS